MKNHRQPHSPRVVRLSFIVGAALCFSSLVSSAFSNEALANDLISLDEPASLESLDGTTAPAANGIAAPPENTGNLDSLESLDGGGLQSLESLSGSGMGESSGEVALDFGGEDFFNPYSFARNRAWVILPFFSLILLGLHLLPVPKRKAKRKIDQSQRFFKGISGDNTSTGIEKMKLMAEKSKSRGDL